MVEKIIFLMGVSGSGKTTVLNQLILSDHHLVLVPSYTTREMRINEKNGRKYRFVSREHFEQAIEKGEFLEYAVVHGKHYYGTKNKEIQSAWKMNKLPIKEIDMYGLEKIKNQHSLEGKYLTIFLDIPDEVMVARILQRDAMSHEELERRLQSAKRERILAQQLCDHIVDGAQDLDQVVAHIRSIIKEATHQGLL